MSGEKLFAKRLLLRAKRPVEIHFKLDWISLSTPDVPVLPSQTLEETANAGLLWSFHTTPCTFKFIMQT